MKLNCVIEFVGDMDRAVKFYRDVLGLPLKFESPGWSEFSTGETSLGLHPASEKNPAGSIELGFNVANLGNFHREMSAKGVQFSMPPTKQDFGGILAQFVDSEGRRCSVAEQGSRSDTGPRRKGSNALGSCRIPVGSGQSGSRIGELASL
jgi:predicted enzyme related to lactoylglutathione lyase